MIRQRRLKLFFTILVVLASVTILNFISTLVNKTFARPAPCLDNYHIKFNGSGYVDKASRWQKLGLTTYVFTAYLDDREQCSALITVMGLGEKSELPVYGTLLLHNGAKIRLGMYREKKVLNPFGYYTLGKLGPYAYLWSLPDEVTTGSSLSSIIVEQSHPITGKTDAKITITRPMYSAKAFGVCIHSPLFGDVKPQTIITSVEINKILGAEWFTFYIHSAQKASLQVLSEYAREGTVEVVLNWGSGLPGQFTLYFGQTLSINECAYRNMYRVKYLVYVDLDEFIVPKKSLGWAAMMAKIDNFKFGTYLFRHSFFFASYSETDMNANQSKLTCTNKSFDVYFPKFLTHTIRSGKIHPPRQRSKYITKPLYTSVIGVHEMFKHVGDFIKTYIVSPDVALLHHYRLFKGGLHPVSSSVVNDQKRLKRIPDKRAFVYKQRIIAALRMSLCRWYMTILKGRGAEKTPSSQTHKSSATESKEN